MIKTKLKAFTLMNFVVGMIITTIIMTSFYEAYQYMNEEVDLYRNQNNSILDALNFEVNMNKDMLRAETIIRLSEDEIQICNSNDKYYYQFNDTYILKTINDVTDTFKIAVNNLKFETENFELVKKITFSSKLDDKEIMYNFSKDYSAEQIVNLQIEKDGN
ncbi:MAG TPA: hypothetical protein VKG26_00535 [Bacteroidia bacterium]|nr:hypothetical protein [Bacteroidia bacterium]